MRRDDPDAFEVGSGPPALAHDAAEVLRVLGPMVTDARRARLEQVVARRIASVALVLEDIADPHNASAALRSADAFGVQEVHVVGERAFVASRHVAKGTHRWLDVHREVSPVDAVRGLQSRGFRVFYASMEGTLRPAELPAIERVALVFGNEHRGPTPAMREACDGGYAIGMRGFVESLNVSVAVAISLHAATAGREGDLDGDARQALLARYLMASVHDSEAVLARELGAP